MSSTPPFCYIPNPERQDMLFTSSRERFPIVSNSDLINGIEKIAPTLRRFQEANDPAALILVKTVLDIAQEAELRDEPHRHWDTFLKTGLHKVVIDILCEDKTYNATIWEDYPALTFVLLRRFGVYLTGRLYCHATDPQILAYADEVLDLLPRLWEYTWKNEIVKRDIPFRIGHYHGESEGLSNAFIYTVDIMTNLHVLRNGGAPPVTNRLSHLLLYIWANSGDRKYDKFILSALVLVIGHAEDETLEPFFQEAVLDKGLDLALAHRFCAELLYEHNLNLPLIRIVSFISAISVHCPSVLKLNVETDDLPQTLIQSVRLACQRQICLSTSGDMTNDLLDGSLCTIKNIMQDRIEQGGDRFLQISPLLGAADIIKIIPMTVRMTFHAIDKGTVALLRCLRFILEIIGVTGERARRGEVVVSNMFKVSRDLWYPTVQSIRAHSIPVNDQTELKEQIRESALNMWLMFGEQLGFHERVEERRIKRLAELGETTSTRLLPTKPGARSCRWKECLCSWDTKPPHRMRICKGCWMAWYCGSNCQTRDWRYGGHKEFCQRHRS